MDLLSLRSGPQILLIVTVICAISSAYPLPFGYDFSTPDLYQRYHGYRPGASTLLLGLPPFGLGLGLQRRLYQTHQFLIFNPVEQAIYQISFRVLYNRPQEKPVFSSREPLDIAKVADAADIANGGQAMENLVQVAKSGSAALASMIEEEKASMGGGAVEMSPGAVAVMSALGIDPGNPSSMAKTNEGGATGALGSSQVSSDSDAGSSVPVSQTSSLGEALVDALTKSVDQRAGVMASASGGYGESSNVGGVSNSESLIGPDLEKLPEAGGANVADSTTDGASISTKAVSQVSDVSDSIAVDGSKQGEEENLLGGKISVSVSSPW